jgi:formylglycine-generating enzyme required for sulfatase activity
MIRGGAFSSREAPTHCAYRSGANLKGVYSFIGFRMAKDLPE